GPLLDLPLFPTRRSSDLKNLPVEPVLNEKGEPVVCHVEIAMTQVAFHAWRVNVGRASVYLLDTNRPENEQHFRDLTLRVYGGDRSEEHTSEVQSRSDLVC